MANDTVYLRNRRPNRVVVQYAGLRVVLERRGSREDSASFPADVLSDSTVARWLRGDRLEELTKDQFMDLSGRTDAFDPNLRSVEYREESRDGRQRVKRSLEPALASDVNEVELAMGSERSETPTVIDIDKIDKGLLTPRVEYRDEVEPTPKSVNAEALDVHDLHRGTAETERPTNEPKEPAVATAKKAPAKKKAVGRPRKTT